MSISKRLIIGIFFGLVVFTPLFLFFVIISSDAVVMLSGIGIDPHATLPHHFYHFEDYLRIFALPIVASLLPTYFISSNNLRKRLKAISILVAIEIILVILFYSGPQLSSIKF